MSADGSRFVYPTGKTPEHIYNTLRVLIDTLNREQSGDEVDLTALQEAIAAAQAAIDEIELNGALTPQQAFELSLVTAVDTLLGSVSNLVKQSYIQSQTAADAVIRALLEGNKNKIAIRVEQTARLTDREAFVNQLEVFSAQIGNALAAVTAETTARTNADNALAQVDQNITTALNGNIAQVQILATSIDGIEQKFAVTLNNNGQVTGLVQLDGSAAGSNFTIVADKFLIAQPDAAGGEPVSVFSLQTVATVLKLALRGDMIADGAIIARSIAALAVTADKIAANAVTAAKISAGAVTADKIAANAVTASKIAAGAITADKIETGSITTDKIEINGLTGSVEDSKFANSATSITSENFSLMSGMSLTISVGSNEKVLVTFTSSARRTSSHAPAEFELRLDGTRVSGSPAVFYPYMQTGLSATTVSNPSASFTVILSPSAGTHTLRIYWRNAVGDGTAYSDYRYFAAMRFLK